MQKKGKEQVTGFLRLDITLGTDSEEPSLCSGDKGIVRAIELFDDIHRQVLQPADKGKPKLLRRLLRDGHHIGTQVFRFCDHCQFTLLMFHRQYPNFKNRATALRRILQALRTCRLRASPV